MLMEVAADDDERMAAEGTPRASNHATSCMMHVVHEPQSAKAETTTVQSLRISCRSASGQGLENVGLA